MLLKQPCMSELSSKYRNQFLYKLSSKYWNLYLYEWIVLELSRPASKLFSNLISKAMVYQIVLYLIFLLIKQLANLMFVYLLKISSFAVSLIFEVLRRHQVQSLTNKYIP